MPITTIQFNPINTLDDLGTAIRSITIKESRCYIYEITETTPVLIYHSDNNILEKIIVDLETDKYYYITAKVLTYTINGEVFNVAGGVYLEFVNVFKGDDAIVNMKPAQTPLVAYAFHQFISYENKTSNGDFTIAGTNRQMGLALGMKLNFMNAAGDVSKVISKSPNAMQTNSWALWGSLSNLLVNALNPDNVDYLAFLHETNATGTSYFHGLYKLVRNPFLSTGVSNDSKNLYDLGVNQPVYYFPYLQNLTLPEGESPMPNNWSLAIKVHNSGADNFIIAGAAYMVFDKNDRGWITTNVMAGTPNSSTFGVVLEPDGSPADFSPVVGGGLLGAGFGLATDAKKENIFFGNFGWGPTQCNPQEGSISSFDLEGNPTSPSAGYTKGPTRAQGLNFDNEGNLWVTSWGSQEPFAPAAVVYPFQNKPSAIVVYLWDPIKEELDYDNPIVQNMSEDANVYRATFDVARHPRNGDMYVVCGGTTNLGKSGLYRCKINAQRNGVDITHSWDHTTDPTNAGEYDGMKQVNFDSLGNVYVGCIATKKSRVVQLNENLEYLNSFRDNINRPWGVTIDNANTIFAGNFGTELLGNETGEHPTWAQLPYRTTGVAILKTAGKGIYRESNMLTLPTGGDEVKLANGFPLYGNIKLLTDPKNPDKTKMYQQPCFIPLMRITSSTIDGAGNLWVMNNWKPSATIDLLENPGGDGVVIFLGVASPAD